MPAHTAENGPRHLVLPGPFGTPEEAFMAAGGIVSERSSADDLEVIGDFVLPPRHGQRSRDFQTMHIDFGLPLVPGARMDIALWTALHIPQSALAPGAVTRLVSLAALWARLRLPGPDELARRFAAYGASHGARMGAAGYCEGSLARIVEAALGTPPALPSVKVDPTFLCGMEFADLVAEARFFAKRGAPIDDLVVEIRLTPGQLVVFDNFAVAHGRRGSRRPGELHQRVFGVRSARADRQRELRDQALRSFPARTEVV